ncbi:50S ribosomal protein L25 [Patescibacteria group bacterium]|nr:50S ribosomal protein L25 [Patescibacteria group bacterium]
MAKTDVSSLKATKRDLSIPPSRLRREGVLPGVLYGRETEPVPLSIPFDAFERLYREAGETTIIGLQIEGEATPRQILVKDTQFDPVEGNHIHVDLYQIKADEELKATVPLKFINEAPAVKEFGGILITNKDEIEVECLPKDLPRDIEVNLAVLTTIDSSITVKDLVIPNGVKTLSEPDESIVVVTPPAAEEVEPEVKTEAEAVAEVEATEEKPATEEENPEEDKKE